MEKYENFEKLNQERSNNKEYELKIEIDNLVNKIKYLENTNYENEENNEIINE